MRAPNFDVSARYLVSMAQLPPIVGRFWAVFPLRFRGRTTNLIPDSELAPQKLPVHDHRETK
jgi:hypothetical protein